MNLDSERSEEHAESILIEKFDPSLTDWRVIELPDAWPDELRLNTLSDFRKLIRFILGNRARVVLPDGMPGHGVVPKYMLQEFHNLPNGYYSKQLTAGYIRSFNRVMLGTLQYSHSRLAHTLRDCQAVLDVGCAGGSGASALSAAGIKDVWGIDPSPYLLQQAANAHPDLKFVQATAENTGFPEERFDGISVCFLMHEIPPKFAAKALQEFSRILRPGGLVAIAEPSPLQMHLSAWELFKLAGWKGLYFKALAWHVFEPFVEAWHKRNLPVWFDEHGFDLVEDDNSVPIRYLLARKR